METNDLPAKEYFLDEYYALRDYLKFSDYYYLNQRVLEKSKQDFLKDSPDFNELQYDSFKEFAETFSKKKELSYLEFSDLLQKKYGTYLRSIDRQSKLKLFANIKTIKNIAVFFTILWIISTLITVIVMFVLLGKFSLPY